MKRMNMKDTDRHCLSTTPSLRSASVSNLRMRSMASGDTAPSAGKDSALAWFVMAENLWRESVEADDADEDEENGSRPYSISYNTTP